MDLPLHLSLDGSDWSFKGFYGEDWNWRKSHQPDTLDLRHWKPGAVPGSVQNDLWAAGEVPNPYFERNSLLIEWVPQRTWVYKKAFLAPKEWQGCRVQLRFEGVDYEAQFFLNGEPLGSHTGMYTPAVFEIGGSLSYGQENLLAVVIEPAPQEQPQVGRTSKVFTQKARMNYWWDFSPRMVHLGIWDSVSIDVTGPVRIEDVFARPRLNPTLDRAEVSVSTQLSSSKPVDVRVETRLLLEGEVIARQFSESTLASGDNELETGFRLDNPQLWWPNGFGEQPLYQAEVRVAILQGRREVLSDRREITFGIRRIELERNDASSASALPYTLLVNNRRVFIKGWNWVPMDVLYGVERPRKLRRLLTLAQRASVNLLRVWGGGLIEKEAFYNLCDRLGILVWQEFIQSSSGIDNTPPSDPEFVARYAGEARRIIPRKRNHPSLAIWCGGNELTDADHIPLGDDHPMLAALKQAVRSLDPDRLWLPTSPSGPLFSNSLENNADSSFDMHDVHGPWEYQGAAEHPALYNQGACLLHSEFGVEGITNWKTLQATISAEHRWPVDLENPVWEHLGAWWIKQRTWKAVYGQLPDIETTVRALQFTQADGLRYAIEANRRRKYHCSGTIPWQFNEPYPMAASTSSVDYYAQPKPAYYAVARAYAPVRVLALFPTQAWAGRDVFQAEIWVSNSTDRQTDEALLEARLIGASGACYHQDVQPACLPANGAAPLTGLRWPLSALEEPAFFLDLILRSPEGETLSENRYVFSRTGDFIPFLHLPPTTLEAALQPGGDGGRLTLTNTGSAVALNTWIEDILPVDSPHHPLFSDNYFSLLPGESRTITVEWPAGVPKDKTLQVTGWNFQGVAAEEPGPRGSFANSPHADRIRGIVSGYAQSERSSDGCRCRRCHRLQRHRHHVRQGRFAHPRVHLHRLRLVRPLCGRSCRAGRLHFKH